MTREEVRERLRELNTRLSAAEQEVREIRRAVDQLHKDCPHEEWKVLPFSMYERCVDCGLEWEIAYEDYPFCKRRVPNPYRKS